MNQIPYGYWKSKITEKMVTQRGRINTLKWDSDERLFFSGNAEGHSFLYEYSQRDGLRKINGDLSVGGNVGYGGGDFDVKKGEIYFSAGKQGLYTKKRNAGQLMRLTHDLFQSASPVISPDGRTLAYVSSDGTDDQIAQLRLDQRSWPQIWIQGADFYMQPCWSADGSSFAWVEWDHPFMPWDASRVMLAEVNPATGTISSIRKIYGEPNQRASQPKFSPDGRALTYIRRNGEWEDLVSYDLQTKDEKILIHGEGFELTVPAFAQGVQTYDWFGDSQRIAFLRIHGPHSEICLLELASGEITALQTPKFTSFDSISVSPNSGIISAIACGPTCLTQVVIIDEQEMQSIFQLGESLPDEELISKPQELSWETVNGSTVFGIFYPPTNPECAWTGLPPAFVHIHGGPTGKTDLRYNPEIQYFTSRGYGWLEVNYRGSSGYGSSFLKSLDGNWGYFDVEDAVSGANCLGKMGLADRNRLMIIGGSAGGYTVLNTLVQFPESFKAGASLYGVADLYSLVIDTHKLELHYTDSLVGPLPEFKPVFDEWSPIQHVENIKAPLAVFQGSMDPVVVPGQAKDLVSRLKSPYVFRLYEGEGHGFRKPETIVDYLETLSDFAKQYLL